MAILRQEPILVHEALTPAVTGKGTTFLSKLIPYGQEPGWILIVRNGSAITGTTPGIVWELDSTTVSGGGSGMAAIGAAIATFSAAGVLVVPYYTGTTQGPV